MSILEFFKLNTNKQLEYLTSLDEEAKNKYLNEIKTKNKQQFFLISGKLKSFKLNKKSVKADTVEIKDEDIVRDTDLSLILPNPMQPRLGFDEDEVKNLAASIKEYKLMQPITLVRVGDKYYILAGETRFHAHRYLNYNTIRSIVIKSFNDITSLEFKNFMLTGALIENVQRKDLDVLELAISIKNAINEGIYKNQAEAASKIKKPKMFATKVLAVLKLNNKILDDLRKNKSIKDVQSFYYISRVKDEKQYEIYMKLVNQEIQRDDILDFIEQKENKTKVISSYKITKTKVEIPLIQLNLDNKNKKAFEEDLEKVINKYKQ